MSHLHRCVLLSLLATVLVIGCGDDQTLAPQEPPTPPGGVSIGEVAFTVEKEGQPATRRSYSSQVYFDTCATSTGIVSKTSDWFIDFGIGGRFAVAIYPVTGEAPLPDGWVFAFSSFTYPFVTPPIPTTGELSIVYVSPSRIDGTFLFRGGADSAGVTWANLVQGSFAATVIPVSACVPPNKAMERSGAAMVRASAGTGTEPRRRN